MQNTKRYWLRGGNIISIIYLLLSVTIYIPIAIYLASDVDQQKMWDVLHWDLLNWSVLNLVLDSPGLILVRVFFHDTLHIPTPGNQLIWYKLFSIPVYFLFGTLCGLVYGKIKNKTTPTNL